MKDILNLFGKGAEATHGDGGLGKGMRVLAGGKDEDGEFSEAVRGDVGFFLGKGRKERKTTPPVRNEDVLYGRRW